MLYATLSNGVKMPMLGYGVYQVDPAECARCVKDAIDAGYRSIDTAQAYCNEEGVGQAVKASGVPREELFITTKVWISNGGYEKAKASIDESLKKQVETHAFFQQAAAHEIMKKYGVVHESWGPFAEGKKDFFTHPVLSKIAAKHGKTVAQVALRFLLQSDVVVIPKSTHKERMVENLQVFDFQLDQEDMVAIRALDDGESAFLSHRDPETVEFLSTLKV